MQQLLIPALLVALIHLDSLSFPVWQAFASGSKKKRKRDGWDNKKGGKGAAALLWVWSLPWLLVAACIHWHHACIGNNCAVMLNTTAG